MKRTILVLSLTACLLTAVVVFQSFRKKDNDYTSDCNKLDYSGCIECKFEQRPDSVELVYYCRSDYNTIEEFKEETCRTLYIIGAMYYKARCRNQDD